MEARLLNMDKAKIQYRNKLISMLKELEDTFYNDSEINSITKFIDNYKESDIEYIRFNWNKKHADEFVDTNSKFREKVSVYYLLNCKEDKNSLLIKDLFVEQSKYDKEAWGASEYLFLLGERLLKDSGTKFVYEFLKGAFNSFDTYGCCLSISLDEKLVDDIKSVIYEMLEVSSDDLTAVKLLNNGLDYVDNFLK